MKKFKDKNGAIYSVTSDSVIKMFENNPEYTEITEKKSTKKKTETKTTENVETENKE